MDRYYVKESTGYLIRPGAARTGNARQITEVLVLDRDYCHAVVWSSLSQVNAARKNPGNHVRLMPRLRAEAARLCAEWNAEDRADAA